MLEIPYESELFAKSSPVQNGVNNLPVTWDDLLWAAITVGRPCWHFVLRHGQSSLFEALFRASALRLAVEQISPGSKRLRRTAATKHLDPSEKGAVSYFLGMTLCKLFAERKLAAPWMLHLDMFRNQLNPRVLAGRSRPDLVGVTIGGQWVAMESKGRVSPPVADTKNKAKKQAERLVAVNGTPVTYRIGAITYFKDECLRCRRNVTVTGVFGYQTVPGLVRQAVAEGVRQALVDSRVDPRAQSVTNEDGTTALLVTAGVRGATFSLPILNQVVMQYRTSFGVA